jgi:LPS export ABC transporter protein LptC
MIKRIFHNKIFLQAAILISCLFVYSCENDEGTLNAMNENKLMVEEGKNITSLISQSGRIKAKLTAPVMLRYQKDTVIVEFPNSLHADFYDSISRKESWLDADYGKYFESLNRVLLRKNVRVVNIYGDTLYTSELWWDQDQKKFYTDSVVRIIQKDKRINGGKGMEAAQDLSTYTIRYPSGTVLVQDDVLPE